MLNDQIAQTDAFDDEFKRFNLEAVRQQMFGDTPLRPDVSK